MFWTKNLSSWQPLICVHPLLSTKSTNMYGLKQRNRLFPQRHGFFQVQVTSVVNAIRTTQICILKVMGETPFTLFSTQKTFSFVLISLKIKDLQNNKSSTTFKYWICKPTYHMCGGVTLQLMLQVHVFWVFFLNSVCTFHTYNLMFRSNLWLEIKREGKMQHNRMFFLHTWRQMCELDLTFHTFQIKAFGPLFFRGF